MASLVELPLSFYTHGGFSLSIHRVGMGRDSADVALVSQQVGQNQEIMKLEVLPGGHLQGNIQETFETVAAEIFDTEAKISAHRASSPYLSPAAAYLLLSRSVARQVLTGHLIALRFGAYIDARKNIPGTNLSAQWDSTFKFQLGVPELSITTFTALNYKLLTEWLETSPSQVLAGVERVSATTIRNRLYSAREIGILGKPGAGRRSSTSIES
jgi:hypothetical protein